MDEPVSLFPRDYNQATAHAQFDALSKEILTLYPGSLAELRADAAFHGQIGVAVMSSLAIVRASNFGKLITVFPFVGLLPSDAIRELQQVFDRYGYKFVDPEILQTVYGGLFKGDYNTWLDRYFGSK